MHTGDSATGSTVCAATRWVVRGLACGAAMVLAGTCDYAGNEGGPGSGGKTDQAPSAARPLYLASILPLGFILEELVVGRGEVNVLLPPGASPHIYEPKPSDARQAHDAEALFYVSDALDPWAARLEASEKIAVFALVPEALRLPALIGHQYPIPAHGQGNTGGDEPAGAVRTSGLPDPHFWSDPLAVAAVLAPLASELARLDPAGSDQYEANAAAFRARLAELDADVHALLDPYAGTKLLLFHASLQYFCRRYDMEIAGVVEPFPGREPTPGELIELAALVKERDVRAIFREPQLPHEPVAVIAETLALPLGTLDPLGGGGDSSYRDLIINNAAALTEVLAR
jgi:ABC-type Zn uptake system ZnuABC Zn-binding protein ZnuA